MEGGLEWRKSSFCPIGRSPNLPSPPPHALRNVRSPPRLPSLRRPLIIFFFLPRREFLLLVSLSSPADSWVTNQHHDQCEWMDGRSCTGGTGETHCVMRKGLFLFLLLLLLLLLLLRSNGATRGGRVCVVVCVLVAAYVKPGRGRKKIPNVLNPSPSTLTLLCLSARSGAD